MRNDIVTNGTTFLHDHRGNDRLRKTQNLLGMLETEYRGVFDRVVFVCATFSRNKAYIGWLTCKKDPCFVAIECEQDQVNRVLEFVSTLYAGTSTLVVLDDCASGNDVKI